MNINRVLLLVNPSDTVGSFIRSLHCLGVQLISYGDYYKEFVKWGLPVDSLEKSNPSFVEGSTLCGAEWLLKEIAEGCFFDMLIAGFPAIGSTTRVVSSENYIFNEIELSQFPILRTSAKNYRKIVTLLEEEDYECVLHSVEQCGDVTLQDRRKLALKVLHKIAQYDARIYTLFSLLFADEKYKPITLEKKETLQYGENPQQEAYLTVIPFEDNFLKHLFPVKKTEFTFHHMIDIFRGVCLAQDFQEEVAVCMRHGNPLWVAVRPSEKEFQELKELYEIDRIRGGTLVITANFHTSVLQQMEKLRLDAICSLQQYSGDERDLRNSVIPSLFYFERWNLSDIEYHYLDGCFVVQERDAPSSKDVFRRINGFLFSADMQKELEKVFHIAQQCSSACVVLWKNGRTIGIGAGQMIRADAFDIAVLQSNRRGYELTGAIVACDGAIKNAELLEKILRSGIQGMVLPLLTYSNPEITKKMNDSNIPILLSNHRHFRY